MRNELVEIFRRKRSDADLQDEFEVFLTEETAENIGARNVAGEARRQARVKLGNPQKVRESLWTPDSPAVEQCSAGM